MDGEQFKHRVRSGYIWNFLGQIVMVLILLGTESARSHLIEPEQIGLIVAAMWLIGFVQVASELGLGAAIVQKKDLTPNQVTAIADVILAISVAFAGIVAAMAPALAAWNQNPGVTGVVLGFVPIVLIEGYAVTFRSLLMRDLKFKAIVRAEVSGGVATLLILVPLAVMGWAAYAIVIAMVSGRAVYGVMLRLQIPGLLARPADYSRTKEALWFGGQLSGARVLFYAYTNADYLLMGRWWPESTLAIYFNGFRLADVAGSRAANIFNQIAFPAFVELIEKPDAVRAYYLATLRNIAVVTFPIGIGLATVAPDAVMALYGPNWDGAVIVLQLISLLLLANCLKVVGPAYLLAAGDVRANVYISLIYTVVLVPALAFGVNYGPAGAAGTWLALGAPLSIGVIIWCGRKVNVSVMDLCRTVAGPGLRVAVMGAVVLGVGWALPPFGAEAPVFWAWIRLLAQVAVGALIYAGWTLQAEPEVQDYVRKKLGRGA